MQISCHHYYFFACFISFVEDVLKYPTVNVAVQLLSHVWLFETPWTVACQASLSFVKLPELAQTHVHWVRDAIRQSHPLSSPSPAFNFSYHQGLFQWVALHFRWLKYWSFSFSISTSNEYPGLISFRIDWFNLLAVQGTPRVFSKTIVLKHQFFSPQPSLWSFTSIHDYWKISFD